MSAPPPDKTAPSASEPEVSAPVVGIPVHWRHRIVIAALYLFLIIVGWFISRQFEAFSSMELGPTSDPMVRKLIMIAALLFVLTSTLPFVPGAEIGLGLLLLFGAPLAILVYGCMVTALVLAFLIGRMVPCTFLTALFGYLRFHRAVNLVVLLENKSPADRLDLLLERAPSRFVPVLLRHRYLALMLALNVPGNTVIGGGGGIAMVAGMSGLFSFGWFLLAVAVAIAPVPLAFFLMG
ncbi:MAG: hypothetical protein Rhims3KO_09440 [Hyphomicrobiales bacterium]